jgi:malate permease and related proteins
MLNIVYAIMPLLFLVVIGYIAGKMYKLSTVQYGYIVAFILAPMVSLGGIVQLEFKLEYIFLPFFVAALSAVMAMIAFYLGKIFFAGTIPNLAGMSSAGGNTGFFGLTVFLLFAPEKMLGLYLLANLGMQITEVTFGYYIGARGNCSVKDSIIKFLKMPSLWAIILGIILNICHVDMNPSGIIYIYWQKILGAWIVIGMMMIGIALAACQSLKPDIKFCTFISVVRFILWPAVTALFIAMDYYYLHLFDSMIYFILMIFSTVPLPGSAVALSATLGLHTDKIAFAVVLSTLLATLIVPFFIPDIYVFLMSL